MARTTVFFGTVLLILAIAVSAAPPARDCWERICSDLTDLGETVNDLVDHGSRRVAKAADKAGNAIEAADSAANAEETQTWFRAATKLAQRCAQLMKRIRQADGPDAAESLNEGLGCIYRSSQALLSARTDDIRGRPDFGDRNRLQLAVVAAEGAIDKAEALIERGKPVRKALKKLQKGIRKMDRLSR